MDCSGLLGSFVAISMLWCLIVLYTRGLGWVMAQGCHSTRWRHIISINCCFWVVCTEWQVPKLSCCWVPPLPSRLARSWVSNTVQRHCAVAPVGHVSTQQVLSALDLCGRPPPACWTHRATQTRRAGLFHVRAPPCHHAQEIDQPVVGTVALHGSGIVQRGGGLRGLLCLACTHEDECCQGKHGRKHRDCSATAHCCWLVKRPSFERKAVQCKSKLTR